MIADADHYHRLAEKIREAHFNARLRTLRFVAFCEQQLLDPHLPLTGKGSLGQLEAELLKRIDTIEREGGELKRRWQHCLATVTVRLMQGSGSLSAEDKEDETKETSDNNKKEQVKE